MKPPREFTIEEIRYSFPLSIKKFAKKCGVSYRTYWNFENGYRVGIKSKIKIFETVLNILKNKAAPKNRPSNLIKEKHQKDW